jgi:hypothetical protein
MWKRPYPIRNGTLSIFTTRTTRRNILNRNISQECLLLALGTMDLLAERDQCRIFYCKYYNRPGCWRCFFGFFDSLGRKSLMLVCTLQMRLVFHSLLAAFQGPLVLPSAVFLMLPDLPFYLPLNLLPLSCNSPSKPRL